MSSQPSSILIVRLSALGDVINTLPVLDALKAAWPKISISWIVEPASAPIVEAQPHVDRTFILDRKGVQRSLVKPGQWRQLARDVRHLVSDLQYAAFDVALDMQGNFRSGLVTRLSRAKQRVGFHAVDRKERDLCFTDLQALPLPAPCHRAEKALHLLTALGVNSDKATAGLPVSSEAEAKARAFLAEKGLKGKRLVVMHPGTSAFGSYKRWTDEGFRDLCGRLCEGGETGVVLTWSGKEMESAAKLAESLHPNVHVSFETSLLELAELCRQANLFVGADTGPGHVASLVGCPVVSIFGPKDPFVYRPYFSPCRVVQQELWCRPCFSRACSAPVCLTGIPVEQVYEAAMGLLTGTKPPPILRVMDNPLLL
ncbi:MAG: glycosyltransferase family 9 protein [Planctomycetota bacterium]|nr:glycosyltransferase family 9 protein [Planctomycetota bacterium]